MNRILLALNPEHINQEAVDFGCYLSKLIGTRLTGVFLSDHSNSAHISTPAETAGSAAYQEATLNKEGRQKADFRKVLSRFGDACVCREAVYTLHREHTIRPDELIQESRYSDILVLDPTISLEGAIEAAPSSLARHIMVKAECPVILAPESFDGIQEIVFTYDGSEASVRAIKQFTYLFPQFRDSKIFILEINPAKQSLTHESKLMEWLNSHYPSIQYIIQQGDPIDKIITFLLPMNNAFVVMGAYGRSFFSRLLKSSLANPVSGTLVNPIFITH